MPLNRQLRAGGYPSVVAARGEEIGGRELHLVAHHDLAVTPHVVGEDHLVHLVERVRADEGDDLSLEADLLLHLARHARRG